MLLLERGDYLPREKENWDTSEVFVKGRYVSKDTWYDTKGKPFQPGLHYFVGGATKLYGAALFRLRQEDFGELRHHDGISPAWPMSYQDLEPYYTEAERLYQVHGLRGSDPTEPPADVAALFGEKHHGTDKKTTGSGSWTTSFVEIEYRDPSILLNLLHSSIKHSPQ